MYKMKFYVSAVFFAAVLLSASTASCAPQYERSVPDKYAEKKDTSINPTIDKVFDVFHKTVKTVTKAAGADTLEFAKIRAAQGDKDALFRLGYMYEEGIQTEKDYQEAYQNYRKAAEINTQNGDVSHQAQNNLGVMYLEGRGVKKDNVQAMTWLIMAGEGGNASALYNLGEIHSNGVTVPQNDTEALYYYKRAADKNHVKSMLLLGYMYLSGYKVQMNQSEAFEWYQKAGYAGSALGQFTVGNMYYNGQGVKKSYSGAMKWYKKAAKQDDADAEYKLGYMYYNGQGTKKKNVKEAVKWWQKAARQGEEKSQAALKGIGESW